jgi:hypothetical protein
METSTMALCQTEPGSLEVSADAFTGVRFGRALSLAGLLLTPVAAVAGALAAWRFGADAGWTNTFFVAGGFLSHWQVWCALAISMQACAWSLGRMSAGPSRSS